MNNNINYLNITVNEIKADSNIQPDWNQNDETAKDYIKNRTHWVEEKAVLEETTFTIEESDGMCALGNFPATLSAGDICTVVYDGKTYTCTVFEFGTDIAGIGCDAFEIAFQNQPDGLCAITIMSYAGEHTILILQTTYHTIPDEFIPWEESPTADSILYTAQSLTEEQKVQARANIGAGTPYTLLQATAEAIGGVKADSAEAADTQPVRIGVDGKLYTAPGVTDISTKMDANNPVGTGSFSMNRKAGTVVGVKSHAEGNNTTASGNDSHAEGNQTTASGSRSHAEGNLTTASGRGSHAEGSNTTASGNYSHAEGAGNTASGADSHAEGSGNTASGDCSHAEGYLTTASGGFSHAQGKCNIEDTSNIYADIIGNGTSDTARSNAATVDWEGNAWFAGDVYTGSTSGTNKDDGSKKLATEEYVNSSIAASGGTYYVELNGSFPNYTLSDTTPLADIAAAYNDGKALFCRCSTGNYTATLPLFVPATELNTWIFSGSGGAAAMSFPAQYFTIVVSAQGVTAEDKRLVQTDAIVTSVSASSTDSEVPSAKCVYDLVGNVTALIDAM